MMEEVKETSKEEGHSKRGGGRIVAFVERVREGRRGGTHGRGGSYDDEGV